MSDNTYDEILEDNKLEEIEYLREQNEDNRAQIKELLCFLTTEEEKNAQLNEDLDFYKNQHNLLMEENTRLQRENEKLVRELAALKEKNLDLRFKLLGENPEA